MTASHEPPSGGTDGYGEAQREQLKRFLPKTESLIWTGSPQLSRLILRNSFWIGVMLLIASVGFHFFYKGITPTDLCGPHPSKVCRKSYVWPWLGLVAAAVYIPLLWSSFLLDASGLFREFYGLTDAQVLKLRSNPFDRFQSTKLAGITKGQFAVRKRFGSIAFGRIVFLSLPERDGARLIGLSEHWNGVGGRPNRIPKSPRSDP